MPTSLLVAFLAGVAFLPTLSIAFAYLVWQLSPKAPPQFAERSKLVSSPSLHSVSSEDSDQSSVPRIYRAGWLKVRRTFEALPETSYVSQLANSYRSFMDNKSKDARKVNKPKERFWAVLKDSVLFLYEDENETDCWAAIEISLHRVMVFPQGLPDGELWMKANAVCLYPKAAGDEEFASLPPVEGTTDSLEPGRPLPWFIFPSNISDKEDWYYSFVQASKLSDPSAFVKDKALFDPADMAKFIEVIDDQPDSLPTRWLNSMIGRLFFAVYRTQALENYIVGRIMRKINRVKKPSFLSDIKVIEVSVGNTVPSLSKPLLKELTADGSASMEMAVSYQGDFRITISTTATINLGARFKSYSVNLVMAVVLKELAGQIVVRVKKPPSNRIWWAFTSSPKMVLAVEPVVSTRQIKWSMITKPIESRIQEIVLESLVLPNMDDIAFFDTRKYAQRGGIWADAARKAADLSQGIPESESELSESEDNHEKIPGFPNVHLGDDVPPGAEGMRKRQTHKRDDSKDSETTARGSSPFSISAWTSASNGSDGEKNGHAKRSSWFSKASIRSPSSSSTVNLPNTSSSASVPTQKSSSEPRIPQRHASVSGEEPDDAVKRLREILQAGTSSQEPPVTPQKPLPAVIQTEPTLGGTVLLDPEAPVEQVRPLSQMERSPSSQSAKTTKSAPMMQHTSSGDGSSILSASPIEARRSPAPSVHRVPPAPSRSPLPPLPKPLPPPQRNVLSSDTASIASTSSSLFHTLRAKANDKQALQASVTQAKDAMKKWSANWRKSEGGSSPTSAAAFANAMRENDPQTPVDDGFTASVGFGSSPPKSRASSRSRPPSRRESSDEGKHETYREHRAAMSSRNSPILESPALPSLPVDIPPAKVPSEVSTRSRALSTSPSGLKLAASKPLTSLDTSVASPTPSISKTHDSPTRSRRVSEKIQYRSSPIMAVPGISDESRKMAIASDGRAVSGSLPKSSTLSQETTADVEQSKL